MARKKRTSSSVAFAQERTNSLASIDDALDLGNSLTLAAVGVKYGKDSDKYEQAGGTKTSERKVSPRRPKRTAKQRRLMERRASRHRATHLRAAHNFSARNTDTPVRRASERGRFGDPADRSVRVTAPLPIIPSFYKQTDTQR